MVSGQIFISNHAKVVDLIQNNIWSWPIEWYDKFPELKKINNHAEGKAVQVDLE